jgi:hypothetical protein
LALIYFVMSWRYHRGVQGLPMLLLVLAAIGCYAMSLAPVTWVVISEIFPNRIRGAAGFMFILLCIPETKGKSLEQIEGELVD